MTPATTELFLDTAYAVALSNETDSNHERAVSLLAQVSRSRARLVTTRAVLLEIGDALARLRFRRAAINFLSSLEKDPALEIVPISEDLYKRAFALYCSRSDKEWGITDCVSFIVMWDRALTAALTTDKHFQQAGFQALLRQAG